MSAPVTTPGSRRFVDLLADRDALRTMLHDVGLVDRRVADDAIRVTPLSGGVSSNIFRVDLAGAAYCIKQALPKLKVASDWQAPIERVFAEIDWLKTVAQVVPGHVPEVIAAHEPSGAFVMPLLDGARWVNWKQQLLAHRVDQRAAQRIGAVLGTIHQASADQPALAQRFAHADNFLALRLDPYLLEAARRTPALAARLHALVSVTQANGRVLIHGDVSPKNILLNCHSSQPMLLDAECATYGDPAFDLAFLLNHCLLKAVHLPASRGELLLAFDAIAQAYWPRVTWEPQAALEARSAALLAGLLLARIDGKSPVEYLSNANRNRVRDLAQAWLLEPPARFSVLRDAIGTLAG